MGYRIAKILMMLMLALQVSAQSLELNETQAHFIINDLNNICGDTWCEGEYDLNFQAIYLKSGAEGDVYVLEFLARNTYEPNAEVISVKCEISDLALIQKIAQLNQLTITHDLQYELYRQVDICINEHLYNR